MRRTWVKLFCDQWLRGSIRKESPLVRAVFADLLALAGDSAFGDDGIIKVADDVGFSDEAISSILNISLEDWLRAKERLANNPDKDENRIEILPLSHGFAIKVLNWRKYQSEYRRQKPYRKKLPPKPPNLEGEGEGEGEGEEKVTQVTEKVTEKVTYPTLSIDLPKIPKNLSFKVQDKLRELKAEIAHLMRLRSNDKARQYCGMTPQELEIKLKNKVEAYCQLIEDYK